MILYFADRKLNILGQASTGLPYGLMVSNDRKKGDVETGVAVFECKIHFDKSTRQKVESYAEVGNYILRSNDGENEFYTIIESEVDTAKQTAYIYAEDAGLDLLNEIVGEYEADKAYNINHYIEKFAYDSGFIIGKNDAAGLTRKLGWTGEQTVTARLASVATQFGGYEISFSFDIEGLRIKNKYINIHAKRGQDIGITLRLNKDISSIITTKSIANLATALRCTGGTPEEEENPITLRGYEYDDGDFYVDGDTLKCRSALKKWSRYVYEDEPNLRIGHEGHIVKLFSYDTPSQATLCAHAITELKKIIEMEVNYEVEISKLPANVRLGDRVNIVDEAGELYLSTRILQLDSSVANQEHIATLGEHLIKSSGIHQKVIDLAAQFANTAKSAAKAYAIAQKATANAEEAKTQANNALDNAEKAQQKATEAATAAQTATQSATEANTKADNAQAAVDNVEESIESLETTVANAQEAAAQAQQAASTAVTKASEAQQAAVNAQAKAEEATTAAGNAQTKADSATQKADTAQTKAEQAIADAEAAATTAAAAKLDAENAQRDIDSLGDSLTTLENTMTADYARKTDLTETTANLQTQISQNAAQITSTATKVQEIDETANDAYQVLHGALALAEKAQEEADRATLEAEAAQSAADAALTAKSEAVAEAEAALEAATTAKAVADKAEDDLSLAIADLESVQSRADATEEEITVAQEAVEAARKAANTAKANSISASGIAAEAQAKADAAHLEANVAQETANTAANNAAIAQQLANEAKGDATKAQAVANEAAQIAAEAQATAQSAIENAESAQAAAIEAAKQSETAAQMATDAEARATQASADLEEAQRNLANVMANVDATEEEVTAAQEAVNVAQAAANAANDAYTTALEAANEAAVYAEEAQVAADTAQERADQAQAAANEATQAAYQAQGEVYGLANRMENAETQITQTAAQIALMATKKEVAKTLGGYSTTEETAAAIQLKADEINLRVDGAVTESADSVLETVTRQSTSIRQDCEAIILSAIESRVDKTTYDEFRETVQTQLKILSDEITMQFSSTADEIAKVNSETQAEFAEWRKRIKFNEDGITIGSGDSAIQMNLDNDQLVFSKHGIEIVRLDIDNFTPANVYIKEGGQLRLGNFGFTVMEDGSPIFGKVGG